MSPQPVNPVGGPGGQPAAGVGIEAALADEPAGARGGESGAVSMVRSMAAIGPTVLNANDIAVRCKHREGDPFSTSACLYFGAMSGPVPKPPDAAGCPDPLARAPRAPPPGGQPREHLYLAPAALQGAIAAIFSRDLRGLALDDAQRLTHFPASPLMSLSWFRDFDVGTVERTDHGPRWQSFGASLVIAGSQSRPTTSWSPSHGYGGMVSFTADVAQSLFGIDPAAVHDRFVPARDVLDPGWRPLLDQLEDSQDDAAILAAVERQLAPRWQRVQGRTSALPSLRQLGRHWVERLALQGRELRRELSPRQVERRIKAHSGRSLREWQSLVRTEGVFFAARDRFDAGLPFDWASIAQDEGFADQAHLSRTARRITGFAPSEFAERFAEDESFWVYRLWV